ncbi:MAG TPA: anti-CBASS Acb1 family protein [Candidatus Sulfotelmatobacter sp.]|nr:anti-CBASS Acb1 family protein [Candidatus Sulfotelmatobacter sp.]
MDNHPVTILNAAGQPIKTINSIGPSVAPFSVNSFAFPQLATFPGAPEISNINGVYDNLRWYLVTNFWQVLSQLYCEIGLIKTIVQVPVDDALRGGCEIQTKELDDTEIQQLLNRMEEKQDFVAIKETGYWDRLYGGSATIPLMDDQDPEQPLDLAQIGPDSNVEFRAVDLWELFWDYAKISETTYGEPMGQWDFEFFSYWGVKIHTSRVWKMTGIKAPSYIRPRLRGWGLSVVEELIRELNRFLKTQDVLYEILDESKVDVLKFAGLIDALFNPAGQNTKDNIARRAQWANGKKNYMHTIVLDQKDDYEIRQPSFSGFAEISQQNQAELSCAMRIPQTKLFGQSAAGFNSGEDDIENYNGMIESEIRPTLKRNLQRVVQVRCQELFGFVPADLLIKLPSMRVVSSTDEENIKTSKHTRLVAAWQAGAISRQQYLDACNKDGLFPIKMETLQLSPDDLPISAQEPEEEKQIPSKAPTGGRAK